MSTGGTINFHWIGYAERNDDRSRRGERRCLIFGAE